MNARLPIAAILALAAAAPAVEDFHAPLYIEAGVSYLGDTARELTTSSGLHLGFGYVSQDTGVVLQTGFGGVDLDWRHAANGPTRLDTLGVLYTERAYGVAGDLYIGYGIGSAFNRLERHTATADGVDKSWRPSAKIMAGYVIGGGLIVETAYHYTGKVAGIVSGGFTLSAGLWF